MGWYPHLLRSSRKVKDEGQDLYATDAADAEKQEEEDKRRFFFTLPETNSSPLKIGHPKRKVVFQPWIFRGYVSFRECNGGFYTWKQGMTHNKSFCTGIVVYKDLHVLPIFAWKTHKGDILFSSPALTGCLVRMRRMRRMTKRRRRIRRRRTHQSNALASLELFSPQQQQPRVHSHRIHVWYTYLYLLLPSKNNHSCR